MPGAAEPQLRRRLAIRRRGVRPVSAFAQSVGSGIYQRSAAISEAKREAIGDVYRDRDAAPGGRVRAVIGGTSTSADPTPTRLRLQCEGYEPTAVCPPGCTHIDRRGKPCKSGGKAVHVSGWATRAFTPDDIRSWRRSRPQDNNTGIRTGAVCAVDGDIPDEVLAAQVDALADQHLGPTPLRRIGRAPKWLRCYRAETPLPKMETPERRLNGSTVQVEILGKGQQVAAYGIHPTTQCSLTHGRIVSR